MKIKAVAFTGFLLLMSFSTGLAKDRIYLRNGETVDGEVYEETRYTVKIKVDGESRIHYMDQVERVERDVAELAEKVAKAMGKSIPVQVSPEKKELILRLMQVNGTQEGIKSAVRASLGKLPPEQEKEFDQIIQSEELFNRLVPVFAKYYSEDEIRELIRFYSSPIGKRALEVTPSLMRESIKAVADYLIEVSASLSSG